MWSSARKNVYVYDPKMDTWTQKDDMPYAIGGCGIAVVDGIIYLVGGSLSVSSPPVPTVMAYDPVTESWTQKADMPTARGFFSACVLDGKIYAIGGAKEDWSTTSYKQTEVYDPSTDTWTRKSDMSTKRWGLSTCVVDGKIYAIGGNSAYSAVTAANEVYNPLTDTWTTKSPMQQRRYGLFTALIGNKIYAIGGSVLGILSTVEEYDTGLDINPPPDDNIGPVADAGSSRYAGPDPVLLDGTGSYDPDNTGTLSYTWRQIAGPSVVIIDANTDTPTIAGSMVPGEGRDSTPEPDGFTQTDEIQECEFELIVSDGKLTSLPDTVKVIIVPDFGDSTLELENPPFDPDKPTIIYFGGGDATSGDVIDGMNGLTGQLWNNDAWNSRANVISFPSGYYPDSSHYEPWATYYRYGDLIIVYLSSVAPNYQQPIQTMGFSLGGNPTLDLGIRLNSYSDARYDVHHVTAIDAATRAQPEFGGSWDLYYQVVELFLNSSVDGEPCWLDFYYGTVGWPYEPFPRNDILWVRSGLGHSQVLDWYKNSITSNDMNKFNGGVVAGAYWSVVGPGKNLQLDRTDAYYFHWNGGTQSGNMNFYNEAQYPGRLPEPVTLIEPVDVEDPNGFVLTCEASVNAVGYELLSGTDPYRVMDYEIISDTPTPPNDVITIPTSEGIWWTVRVRDQNGSTIYADPKYYSMIAYNPDPSDSGMIEENWAYLSWTPGLRSESHDVYFSDNFNDVNDGTIEAFQGNQTMTYFIVGLPDFLYPEGLSPDAIYYWRIDEIEADGTTVHKGKVWSFTVMP
jgi:hypothetical protein